MSNEMIFQMIREYFNITEGEEYFSNRVDEALDQPLEDHPGENQKNVIARFIKASM